MTTPRPLARMRRAAAGLAIAVGLFTMAGCDPRALFYFLQPFEPTIHPPCPSLKGKRVVVLTHASSESKADFPAIEDELAQRLIPIFREKVRHIELVPPDKVRTWSNEHPSWSEPSEAAEWFDADVVVFLEINAFRIQSPNSPGLLSGDSKIQIQVFELAHPKDSYGKEITTQPKEPEKIYEATCDTAYPRVQTALPLDVGVSRPAFQAKFLKLVAAEVSWHFVDHAPGDNVQDLKFNQ